MTEYVRYSHWVTGKAVIEILCESGNLPVVGTGNVDSRSRVIDCAEIIINSGVPAFESRNLCYGILYSDYFPR